MWESTAYLNAVAKEIATSNLSSPRNDGKIRSVSKDLDTLSFCHKLYKKRNFLYCFYFIASNSRFNTTVAEISRFAASGITNERGDSITSSVTIILRRTGRQCIKCALLVTAI